MAEYDYDLFVIGAGSGGVRGARIAAGDYGAKVAIAEEYRVGGTCQQRGCVPKKLMVYAAEYGQGFEQAKGYGWSCGTPTFDWPGFIARKDSEIARLSGFSRGALTKAGVEIIEDRAVFEDAHTLRLVGQDRTVTAKRILVAVGGTPSRPTDLAGGELAITSDEAFHLDALPGHVVVVGGGYIACEFACIFKGLGAQTTLVYRGDTVLRGFDEDVRKSVHAELERQGIDVITNAVFTKLERTGDGRIAGALTNGQTLTSDAVMFAIGRAPKTDGLGLAAAGVHTTPNGAIPVDRYSKTNVDHIFAVGDVTDRIQLTPVAIREGHAFADTVFGGKDVSFDHDTVASAVFTTPPAGSVGLSEHDAVEAFGRDGIDIYRTNFRSMRHVLSGEEQRVMMKLVVRKSDDVVVGCHMVGEAAGELIQLAGVAVKARLTKAAWDATCAVHPTISEEFVLMRQPVAVPDPAAV